MKSVLIYGCLLMLLVLASCGTNSRLYPEKTVSGHAVRKIKLSPRQTLALEDGGALESYQPAIEKEIRRTLVAVSQYWNVGELYLRVFASRTNVIREIGLNGYTPSATEIRLFIDPEFPTLDDSIKTQLFPLLAHELHHARRTRLIGYGSTLLEAAVSEGLADHFSMQVAGVEPPIWSKALEEEALSEWMQKASAEWESPGYRHSDWFLGVTPDIPRWTGYAIGFVLVGDYLQTHPDQNAAGLVGEPARRFLPHPRKP